MVSSTILAAGNTDWTGMVPFLAMVVFMVILTIMKRLRRGPEETPPQSRPAPREAEEFEEEAPPQHPPPPRRSTQAPALPDWMRPAPPPQQPRRVPQPAPRPSPGPEPAAAPRPRPMFRQAPTSAARPAEVSGDLAEQVDQEMLAQQDRRRLQDEDRSRRMASIHLAKAPQLGGISQLRAKSIAPAAARVVPAEPAGAPAPLLDLNDPQQLRTAMILHEIFMPPKAFRAGQEMWDL